MILWGWRGICELLCILLLFKIAENSTCSYGMVIIFKITRGKIMSSIVLFKLILSVARTTPWTTTWCNKAPGNIHFEKSYGRIMMRSLSNSYQVWQLLNPLCLVITKRSHIQVYSSLQVYLSMCKFFVPPGIKRSRVLVDMKLNQFIKVAWPFNNDV